MTKQNKIHKELVRKQKRWKRRTKKIQSQTGELVYWHPRGWRKMISNNFALKLKAERMRWNLCLWMQ
jgi:hypothetical protein